MILTIMSAVLISISHRLSQVAIGTKRGLESIAPYLFKPTGLESPKSHANNLRRTVA
jgi:hypothetical protein